MSDLVESIFSGMPTVGSKKSSFVCDIDQSDSWVVSYPRKLWTPAVGFSRVTQFGTFCFPGYITCSPPNINPGWIYIYPTPGLMLGLSHNPYAG
jgi:hypothetical protein